MSILLKIFFDWFFNELFSVFLHVNSSSNVLSTKFNGFLSQSINEKFEKSFKTYVKKLKKEKPKLATRQASMNFLEILNSSVENTIGGSADLTGSNLTKTHKIIT